MDSTLDHGIIFWAFGFPQDSWIAGLDRGHSALDEDGRFLIFILLGQDREVHVADLEYGFFLKNVLVKNELIFFVFGLGFAISWALFWLIFFALNGDHEIFVVPEIGKGYSLIRDVFDRYGVSQRDVFLTGFDEGCWGEIAFGEFDGDGIERALR